MNTFEERQLSYYSGHSYKLTYDGFKRANRKDEFARNWMRLTFRGGEFEEEKKRRMNGLDMSESQDRKAAREELMNRSISI
jgi:hypothetical protein